MSDTPTAAQPVQPVGEPSPHAGTADLVEVALERYRQYLRDVPVPSDIPAESGFDMATVVAQFTALRHDVSLQTKATRQAIELMQQQTAPRPQAEASQPSVALLAGLIAVADQLHTASVHVSRLGQQWAELPKPNLWQRMFGPVQPTALPPLASVADGYAMSLRRVDALLAQQDLMVFDSVGQPFDPETMEAIERDATGTYPAGTVARELRRGYTRNGALHRTAQVVVG